jgi:hypothetical protein
VNLIGGKKMINKSLILTVLALLTFNLYSQDTGKDKKTWEFDLYGKDYFYKSRPTIDITYGASKISLKNSGVNFNDAGLIEVKLGYTYLGKSKYSKSISRFESNYFYGSYISSKINAKKISGAEDKTWRFGIGNANGYGYMLGKKSSLVLYNSNSFTWTRYDDGFPIALPPEEMNSYRYTRLSDFNNTLRFGTTTEAGIIVPIAGFVNLQAQYDRTLVFPRHLFWKHLGSLMVEGIGQAAVDGFVKAIMKSSPTAGPILNFILKNALSYGIYELRREKMNWPFNSAEPLMFESFKAGFTFTF